MADMGMAIEAWRLHDALMAVVMWAVMMIATMLPSAAPMILVFTAINRKRRAEAGTPHVNTALFVAGYLMMWSGFSRSNWREGNRGALSAFVLLEKQVPLARAGWMILR